VSGHVWRPVLVILALVVIGVAFRQFYVPDDFGVQARGYTYGWYRQGSSIDWKWMPLRYQSPETCEACHKQQVSEIRDQPHASIQCQDCHGPALDHPDDPQRLVVDTSRALCLRCHARLPYPSSARGGLRGIDAATHNPGRECVECHQPHHPTLTAKQRAQTVQGVLNETCRPCHLKQVQDVVGMPHEIISCERCHGPKGDHPSDPAKLVIDTSRELCVTCHTSKKQHNAPRPCVTCHDPHKSALQFLQFLPPAGEAAP